MVLVSAQGRLAHLLPWALSVGAQELLSQLWSWSQQPRQLWPDVGHPLIAEGFHLC